MKIGESSPAPAPETGATGGGISLSKGPGLSLSKGEKISLTKAATDLGVTNALDNLMVGLGWDVNNFQGAAFDLDASVFMVDGNEKVLNNSGFIFYGQPSDPAGSVVHSGDNKTGEGEGDDERIKVVLSKVPADIQKIIFTVTIYECKTRNQNFGQVSNAYIRVINADTNEELLRYDLGEDYSIETAVVIAEIYKNNGEWKFNAVGAGFQGGLSALCANFGISAE